MSTSGPSTGDIRRRLRTLPRVELAHLPTPLDECGRLAEHLDIGLRIKRDDCTGLAFGGNKSRQHEYVIGDALAAGSDCIIQGAAAQSNHSRQLAAAGAKLGVEVHLLPRLDSRSSPVQGNYLIDHVMGVHLHPIQPGESSITAKAALAQELRDQGRHPYIVGMGAQRASALAAVAYVEAACEIVEAQPDRIPTALVVASQGSTQAGLQLGFELLGLEVKVFGMNPVPEDHEAYLNAAGIVSLARDAADILGVTTDLTESDIYNSTEFSAPGYGVPSPAGMRALTMTAALTGIILDPVYSAKAMAGLISLREKEILTAADDVVFLHTGGLPINFAYAAEVLQAAEQSLADRITS